MTCVMGCVCKHAYQDRVYGRGRRVHNEVKSTTKHGGKWRCTVCKRVK